MMRLQKFLAQAGVASRRESEHIILSGQVKVNGKICRILGTKVDPAVDQVTVEDRLLSVRPKLYLALHKPSGFLCTRSDPEGRPTVHDLFPPDWGDIYSVGRLDRYSEGLLLLTNDGDFALHLTHPRYGVLKVYQANVPGAITPAQLATLTSGVEYDGETLRAVRAHILEQSGRGSLVELELGEGKNREVRRMFETLGFEVTRLRRLRIGRIPLGELPLGKWRHLAESEIRSLTSGSRPPSTARPGQKNLFSGLEPC